ncbi:MULTISPECIES: hypothetical protein [Pseudonocardia]|uniref:Uncharacterized protein n=1 Tax=Pseudonocardia xishanensis TaxID=630995 RepID=A0ABP8RZL2_9PSEU|nr:hypothetical protein [Pseudonocardia sp. WMMC193]MCF7547211.1 hypothetical protein [Pseudonocardia sp. WMMC193]
MRSDRELSNISHWEMTDEELARVAEQEAAQQAAYTEKRAAERAAFRASKDEKA